jgi:hypothetical protein
MQPDTISIRKIANEMVFILTWMFCGKHLIKICFTKQHPQLSGNGEIMGQELGIADKFEAKWFPGVASKPSQAGKLPHLLLIATGESSSTAIKHDFKEAQFIDSSQPLTYFFYQESTGIGLPVILPFVYKEEFFLLLVPEEVQIIHKDSIQTVKVEKQSIQLTKPIPEPTIPKFPPFDRDPPIFTRSFVVYRRIDGELMLMPAHQPVPAGMFTQVFAGTLQECLEYMNRKTNPKI